MKELRNIFLLQRNRNKGLVNAVCLLCNIVVKHKVITLVTLLCLFVSSTNIQAQRRSKSSNQRTSTQKNKKQNSNNTKQPKRGSIKKGSTTKNTNTGSTQTNTTKQDSTIKASVVTVTSSFKPILKQPSKIAFTASQISTDTGRYALNYSIPAQNLTFAYQPVPIKPLGLQPDSIAEIMNSNYAKLGFGNYATIVGELGLSFGNINNTLYTITAKHINGKGSLLFQEYSQTKLQAEAQVNNPTNLLIVGANYALNNQYKFGTITNFAFTKDMLQQRYGSLSLYGNLSSKEQNNFGIGYKPNINLNLFNDNRNNSEFTALIDANINKRINKNFGFDIGVVANISSVKHNSLGTFSNNIFAVTPNAHATIKDIKINAGLHPTWDNSELSLLPNITAEAAIGKEDNFVFFGGWKSQFVKNTFNKLASVNPFIAMPTSFINTRFSEQFVGFKGSLSKHLTFNIQGGLVQYKNFALFINDTAVNNEQTFLVNYEPNISGLRISGEIAYTVQEKLTVMATANITQFTTQNKFNKAYGFVPTEISGSARYRLTKDLHAKADVFFFGGIPYRTKSMISERQNPALDINLGAEFTVLKKISVWVDVNNLFNNQYQRWNQYNVIGFNIMGGVKYNF